ncbi:MAG: hypothetical protein U0T75_12360 [Chitinophagales bacterium]
MSTHTGKRVGIWLDHVQAQFVDISKGLVTIETAFADEPPHMHFKGETGIGTKISETRSSNDEAHQHNRKMELRQHYLKMLANRLRDYDVILLLGPGTAPHELRNKLQADPYFKDKIITLEACDYITDNQLMARVLKHFEI